MSCGSQTSEESLDDASHGSTNENHTCPRYADMIFLINPDRPHWKSVENAIPTSTDRSFASSDDSVGSEQGISTTGSNECGSSTSTSEPGSSSQSEMPLLDVVFVHGLRGGPFKTWRLSEDKYSTKSGLVEKIDEEAGKQGTFWPGEWLPADFPGARLYSLKYKVHISMSFLITIRYYFGVQMVFPYPSVFFVIGHLMFSHNYELISCNLPSDK